MSADKEISAKDLFDSIQISASVGTVYPKKSAEMKEAIASGIEIDLRKRLKANLATCERQELAFATTIIGRDELRNLIALLSAPQDRDVGGVHPLPADGRLCVSGVPSERKPKWILRFGDTDMSEMLFDNEQEAVRKFDQCKDNWTCELLVTASYPSTPPSVAVIPEGWQPFRTAPRDGTPFLAYWERRHTDKTRYDAALPYVVAAFYANTRIIPTWVAEDLPTHWMPLPAAPGSASPSPVVDAPIATGERLEAEEKEMFRLADRLGYVCTPEPHPDSPHVQEQEETRIAIKDEALNDLQLFADTVADFINEKGGAGGYLLARLSDARKAIASLKGQP